MATRPTNSSFFLVNPMPPEVPNIPSSTFSCGFAGACHRTRNKQKKKKKTNMEFRDSDLIIMEVDGGVRTFFTGAALVFDLKRARVVNAGEEVEEEVGSGGRRRWEKGLGLSL